MYSAIFEPIKVKMIDNAKASFRRLCLHQSNFMNNINSERKKNQFKTAAVIERFSKI